MKKERVPDLEAVECGLQSASTLATREREKDEPANLPSSAKMPERVAGSTMVGRVSPSAPEFSLPARPSLKTESFGVSYVLTKPILEALWLERLRQKQLFRDGKILFTCDSAVVSHDRKLRVLSQKFGEAARAIDQIEFLNPSRQPRAELSEPSTRAKNDLRQELTQLAALTIAWLEALQKDHP